MRIKRQEKNLVYFKDINIGEVFESDGEMFLKIEQNECNAIGLDNGYLYNFDYDDLIIPHPEAMLCIE